MFSPKIMLASRYPSLFVATALIVMAALPAFAVSDNPPIFIPRSESAVPTIDGVWTSSDEWRKASETIVKYADDTELIIKANHDTEKLYVLLEMPNDYVLDGHASICFDTSNEGGPYMKADDYCFVLGSTLGEFHGDGRSTLMQDTMLNPNASGARGLSGANSPYESDKDHVTYEFAIPLDYLSDRTEYGFYVVFDTRGQTTNYTYYYSWPDFNTESSLRVQSPRDWGQVIISSEVNVPEFPMPLIALVTAVTGIIAILTRFNHFKIVR